jgi:hypothetical protein
MTARTNNCNSKNKQRQRQEQITATAKASNGKSERRRSDDWQRRMVGLLVAAVFV